MRKIAHESRSITKSGKWVRIPLGSQYLRHDGEPKRTSLAQKNCTRLIQFRSVSLDYWTENAPGAPVGPATQPLPSFKLKPPSAGLVSHHTAVVAFCCAVLFNVTTTQYLFPAVRLTPALAKLALAVPHGAGAALAFTTLPICVPGTMPHASV